MQQAIEATLAVAVAKLTTRGILPNDRPTILVQPTPAKIGGDYATNLALTLAPATKLKPLDLATELVAALPAADWLDRAEVASPGFINFYCRQESILRTIAEVLAQGDSFGAAALPAEEKGKKILVEYVSANPTGPLHIGHGRAAAIGSAMVNVMNFAGYKADGEYYVNDRGRQMKILTATLCLRLMRLMQSTAEKEEAEPSLPEGFYQGAYLADLAKEWREEDLAALSLPEQEITALLEAAVEKEERLDKITELLEESLGAQFRQLTRFILRRMIRLIKKDLAAFATHHNSWYYESETAQEMDRLVEDLRHRGLLYEREGALWFRSRKFGDDKDRVLKRSNSQPTYFIHDIAYHDDKYARGYDRLVDVLGSDHHGYMNRIRASMQALGRDPDPFAIHLVQLVFLVNDVRESLSMSTRANRFVSLRELIDLVGVDVARFFFLMHRADQPLNFDLKLAVSSTKDNPVYYVQYAHARIASLFAEQGDWKNERRQGIEELALLNHEKELQLATVLNRFPALIADIAQHYEVHQLTIYLRDLARGFHSYYNGTRILGTEATAARLCLCAAVQQTLANGLTLLGVDAPLKM